MTDEHVCVNCGAPAAVEVKDAVGGVTYVCTSVECLMDAGVCPNCHAPLERTVDDKGAEVMSCPACHYHG